MIVGWVVIHRNRKKRVSKMLGHLKAKRRAKRLNHACGAGTGPYDIGRYVAVPVVAEDKPLNVSSRP